jgi:hypothetical protein
MGDIFAGSFLKAWWKNRQAQIPAVFCIHKLLFSYHIKKGLKFICAKYRKPFADLLK